MTDTFAYLGVILLLTCSFNHLFNNMGQYLLILAGTGQTLEFSDQDTVLCPQGDENLVLRSEINTYN